MTFDFWLEDSRKKKMKWMTLPRIWSDVQGKEEAARRQPEEEDEMDDFGKEMERRARKRRGG